MFLSLIELTVEREQMAFALSTASSTLTESRQILHLRPGRGAGEPGLAVRAEAYHPGGESHVVEQRGGMAPRLGRQPALEELLSAERSQLPG